MVVDALAGEVWRRTWLFLCIFPTAFFFFAAYNESLFLLLTASAFLAMRRQKWWLAGILGFLAALTRSAGLFLVIPFLWELWMARETITGSEQSTMRRLLDILNRVFPDMIIPLATFLYCGFWY